MGVTSVIRELYIDPKLYETMLHFFRSEAFGLENLVTTWVHIVKSIGYICLEDHMPVLVINGIKKSKEGRKMPGVKNCIRNPTTPQKPNTYMGICLVWSVF